MVHLFVLFVKSCAEVYYPLLYSNILDWNMGHVDNSTLFPESLSTFGVSPECCNIMSMLLVS